MVLETRPGVPARGRIGDCLQGVGAEVLAHVTRREVPDGQEHALTLVVARAVLMGLTEITEGDGAVDGRDDLGEFDLGGRSREDIPASDAALRPHEAGTLQGEKNLLQIGLGKPGALRNVAHGGRADVLAVEGEREEGPAGIVTPSGDAHAPIVGGGLEQ